jgi:puromycin-sensitive aminopeptidase
MLAVHAWKPEWDRWTTFGVSRAAAMTVDGLHSTRPIEYPVQAPKDAEAMFDVLTYEKGASVLRMLEQYLGPEVFRDGVRRYLRAHAYANADTGDLWTALGEASREPVPALMDGWIFHPGYPLVTATLDRAASPPALRLSQQRFTYLPAETAGGRWQIPVRYRVDGVSPTVQRTLLTESTVRVPLADPEAAVVVNEGGHGFYRVRYEGELRDRIERLLTIGRLSAIERFNLLSDAWAAAIAGLTPLGDYLALTARFEQERDKNVWSVLLGSFDTLYRLTDRSQQPRFGSFIRARLNPAWQALGWVPQKGEDELTRQLRGDLLRVIGTIGGEQAVVQEAAARFRYPDVLDPNVLPAVIAILAYTGDAARYDEFVARYRAAATPQEERRYLYSLAAFRLPALVERTLQSAVNGDIRTQDAPFIIRLLLMNPEGRETAWAFVKREWDAMAKLFPKSGLRRMCEGVIGLATPELERDVRRFFAERKIDLGGRTLDQYLEQLRIAVALREREGLGRLAGDILPS